MLPIDALGHVCATRGPGCGWADGAPLVCGDEQWRASEALRRELAEGSTRSIAPHHHMTRRWRAGAARGLSALAASRPRPARTATAPKTKRGMSPAFAIIIATERRGGMPDDDWSLAADGVDSSRCEAGLRIDHGAVIGEVLEVYPAREKVMARVRLDLDTEDGARLWERREAGLPVTASVEHEVLDADPYWPWRAMNWRLHHVTLGSEQSVPVDPGAVSKAWTL